MANKKKNPPENTNAIWAAVITGIVTIIVTILGLPPLIEKIDSLLNPTATPASTPPPTETPTSVPAPPFLETATQPAIIAFTDTPAIPAPPTLTPIPANGVMIAQIKSNYLDGKAPFRATFRAGSSYLTFQDGSVQACEFANVCSYTWDVREQNGPTIHGPVTGGSEFSYEFTKKGVFMVVVYVCRGQACNFTSVSVTAR